MSHRVVITGVGAVSALGTSAQALWDGLCAGRSGLKPITRFDASGFPCRLGGEVPELSIKDLVPKSYRKATKVMARDIELAVAAARGAVEDAGLITRGAGTGEDTPEASFTYPSGRMGCHIGAGLIAAETDEISAAMSTAREDGRFSLKRWGGGEWSGGGGAGMEALTPLWLLKYLPNMLACHVTIIHGAEGPSNTITCAEASGLLSIGESTRVIERDAADLCFSGSAESKLNLMGLLRMDFAKRVAHAAPDAEVKDVLRPFATDRHTTLGGIIGEGGGIAILERHDKAIARGAKPYAEIVGFGGGTSDAYYRMGESDPGVRYAIENALEDAGLQASAIDAIVPLGSGVAHLDAAEAGALKAVFGARLADVPVVLMQPGVGNAVAGAGGLQVVVAAMMLRHQMLPASPASWATSLGTRGAAGPARPAKLEHVLVFSPSLGGQNAAVVLKRV